MEATCRTTAVFQSRTRMEANQRNARWSGFAATRFPHRRDGGDLSYGGSFPKSDTNGGEPEERMEDGRSSLCRRRRMEANQRNAWRTATVAFAVGDKWRRTRGTHGGRHKYCRPVAMEAICQPGYYVRRRAWAAFPKSDANIRHWSRHEQVHGHGSW